MVAVVNIDSEAIQLKLDALIRAAEGAHNGLLDIEELTEDDLNRFRARYGKRAGKVFAARNLQHARRKTW